MDWRGEALQREQWRGVGKRSGKRRLCPGKGEDRVMPVSVIDFEGVVFFGLLSVYYQDGGTKNRIES
jgi:hypothetical protein